MMLIVQASHSLTGCPAGRGSGGAPMAADA